VMIEFFFAPHYIGVASLPTMDHRLGGAVSARRDKAHDMQSPAARAVLGRVIEHYGLPVCCMAFPTATGMNVTGNYGVHVEFVEHPVDGKNILFHGVDRKLPIIIYDALNDARYCHDPLVAGPPYVRFFIGVPIILHPNIRMGTLCLMDTEPRTFYPLQECHFAMQAAEEIAQALGEAGGKPTHFEFSLETLGAVPTLSRLPTIGCSMDDSSASASTPEVNSLPTMACSTDDVACSTDDGSASTSQVSPEDTPRCSNSLMMES